MGRVQLTSGTTFGLRELAHSTLVGSHWSCDVLLHHADAPLRWIELRWMLGRWGWRALSREGDTLGPSTWLSPGWRLLEPGKRGVVKLREVATVELVDASPPAPFAVDLQTGRVLVKQALQELLALVHAGRLYVADGGNRRVLVWRDLPDESGVPADFALGQRDLASRSDNAGGEPGPGTFRWPHDLAVLDGDLVVTDAGNNRVLIWDGAPDEAAVPAARVLGQTDFGSVDHNRASYWPDARCLNMPYAVAVTPDGALAVADAANSRLVAFRTTRTGDEAAALTGQAHFGAKGDNRWLQPVRDSLCWPYGLRFAGDAAIVCDTGNHRVALWRGAR